MMPLPFVGLSYAKQKPLDL